MLVIVKLAKAGTFVRKGEVVAEFDSQYQLNRQDDFKAWAEQLDAGVKKLQADLAVAKEAYRQLVRVAKADVDKTRLDLKTIEVRSAIESEKFKLAADEAAARYKQMLAEMALFDASQAAQLRAAEMDLEQARIDLQRATVNVERMVLKAPIDGIVVMQSIWRGGDLGQVQQGDQIWPGMFFMQVVDPRSMVVNATVNQVDSDHLRIGMKANVRLDAYPGLILPGHIVGIGAITRTGGWRASFVKEVPVRLKLDDVDPRLFPDLSASADVLLESERQVTVVPRQAIFYDRDNGRPFVYRNDVSGWQRAYVDLGLTNHVVSAVRSGIRQGDLLAARLLDSQGHQ
jgi:multidrug resistance efflux pump